MQFYIYAEEIITYLKFSDVVNLSYASGSRLEEKLTNLESENQVLRQQAVSLAPNKFLSGRSRSIVQVVAEI